MNQLQQTLEPSRDESMDMVKGDCVLVMLLYHTIVYFRDSSLDLKFLNFVTGAFVFMAGLVASSVYLVKYGASGQWAALLSRLVVRGGKLILLAMFLNAILFWISSEAGPMREKVLAAQIINLLNGINFRQVSFELLVIIGYVLMFIGLLLAVSRGNRALLASAALGVLICAAFAHHYDWPGNYYIRLIAIGLLGGVAGLLHRKIREACCGRLGTILLLYFTQHLFAIVLPHSYIIFVVNVFFTLLLMYAVSLKCDPREWIWRAVILLGRYSLVAYLFHIALLQILRRKFIFVDSGVLFAYAIGCVITFAFIALFDILRKEFKIVATIYRFVFC